MFRFWRSWFACASSFLKWMFDGMMLSKVSFLLSTSFSTEVYTPVRIMIPVAQHLLTYANHPYVLAVGIIGATVMPHSLFIGSALATQDRMSVKDVPTAAHPRIKTLRDLAQWLMSRLRSPGPVDAGQDSSLDPKNHLERENNSFAFVRTHLYHGIADLVVSLMGFAVIINSLYVWLHHVTCEPAN